jgi:hypothetical protein
MAHFNVEFTVTLSCSAEIEADSIEEAENLTGQYDWKTEDIGSEDICVDEIYEIE